MSRILSYAQALLEGTDLALAADPNVYIVGLGVPDPKGLFGTTLGLVEKYGESRVMDMPCAENAMTGIAIGSALSGLRPILTHQRVDFATLTMEQLANQAAKWHYMFGGRKSIPLVVRMILGRGWGQGPQHSQSLQAWFAHIPGLRVIMPTTPHDAKGMLISALEDNNPVVYLEHRWLHAVTGPVPEGLYRVPIGPVRIAREGKDVTLVATSYMVLEALRSADLLAARGIEAEVLDLRAIAPLDRQGILASVRKTGRLVVADTGTHSFGIGAEIISSLVEEGLELFKAKPARVSSPDFPSPTSPALSNHYYPRTPHIVAAVLAQFGQQADSASFAIPEGTFLDVPDKAFQGPF
ncbi:pyruvate dehydrogenase E1 component beta subunit [Verrucomicrobium sp. GAS474]|uniref:alpha-ketoacid dehydrogenase subunit beta n=1 Tax=Verrucomicrobium sp. GAS474 TaxID=1882831 RepID=UPI00087C6BBC|nr:transketolase C-terminal domain-containing protein [Verrucomicrobium sp. GAS474]SDT94753.1 pyruvate dehydrogenase E1 component beta subunit [Verrucomicrobium sp. GAS474]